MFDMIEIGRRIAGYRKEKGMTQMGLANELGVSYQAVSNWERGESMPDIAKLEDLSRELSVSIDEILGNDKKSKAAEALSRGEMPENIKEVLPELLPVMTPKQIEESVEKIRIDTWDISYLISIAPFITKDVVSEMLEKHKSETLTISQLLSIAPFADKEIISSLALNLKGELSSSQLCGLAPFLKQGILDKVIKNCVSRPLTNSEQMSLFPFLGRETLAQLLKMQLEKGEKQQ